MLVKICLRRALTIAAAGSVIAMSVTVPGAAGGATAGTPSIGESPHEWISALRARPVLTTSSGLTYYEIGSYFENVNPITGNVIAYYCADVDDSHPITSGTKVQLWQCKGTKNQLWAFVPTSSITPPPPGHVPGWTFVNDASGLCMDAATAPVPIGDGTNVQVWNCNGRANQAWFFNGLVYGGDIEYENGLTDPADGSTLCLTAADLPGTELGPAGDADGAAVQVSDCNAGDGIQLW